MPRWLQGTLHVRVHARHANEGSTGSIDRHLVRILHCSDVHITADYRKLSWSELGWRRLPALVELYVRGRNNAFSAARETLGRVLAAAKLFAVDHIILTGDVTAYSLESEFDDACEVLSKWGIDSRRLTIIPGNHDTYTPEVVSGGSFEKRFGAALASDLPEYAAEGRYPTVKLLGAETVVIGLNSARVPKIPGLSLGWIGELQRRALQRVLQDRRVQGRAVFVGVHHAPLSRAGGADKPLHGLLDAHELLAILAAHPAAILHGHIHQRYVHPATPRRPLIFGAGSSTQAGSEGYWLIDTEGSQFRSWDRKTLPPDDNVVARH